MTSFFKKLEKSFMAATFAEADCPDAAREIMEGAAARTTLEEFLDNVGLGGVRYNYVVASL